MTTSYMRTQRRRKAGLFLAGLGVAVAVAGLVAYGDASQRREIASLRAQLDARSAPVSIVCPAAPPVSCPAVQPVSCPEISCPAPAACPPAPACPIVDPPLPPARPRAKAPPHGEWCADRSSRWLREDCGVWHVRDGSRWLLDPDSLLELLYGHYR